MVIFGEKIIRIGLSLYLKVIAVWYGGFLDFTLPVTTLIMTSFPFFWETPEVTSLWHVMEVVNNV